MLGTTCAPSAPNSETLRHSRSDHGRGRRCRRPVALARGTDRASGPPSRDRCAAGTDWRGRRTGRAGPRVSRAGAHARRRPIEADADVPERLHSDLRMELEVPVAHGDQRAWDSIITRFADDPTARLPRRVDRSSRTSRRRCAASHSRLATPGSTACSGLWRERAAIERRFARQVQSSPAPFRSTHERHCGLCARADIPAGRA